MSSIQQGRLRIIFGATAENLSRQIEAVGLDGDSNAVDDLQRYADAVTLLSVQGVLSEGEAHKARQRLMKRIVKAVQMQHPSAPREHTP